MIDSDFFQVFFNEFLKSDESRFVSPMFLSEKTICLCQGRTVPVLYLARGVVAPSLASGRGTRWPGGACAGRVSGQM